MDTNSLLPQDTEVPAASSTAATTNQQAAEKEKEQNTPSKDAPTEPPGEPSLRRPRSRSRSRSVSSSRSRSGSSSSSRSRSGSPNRKRSSPPPSQQKQQQQSILPVPFQHQTYPNAEWHRHSFGGGGGGGGRGRYSRGGGGGGGHYPHYQPTFNPNQMMSYKQYIETLDDSITPEEGSKLYEQYRQRFISASNAAAAAATTKAATTTNKTEEQIGKEFFAEHAAEGWMKDLFDPVILSKRWTEICSNARNKATSFMENLKQNMFDCPLDSELYNLDSSLLKHPSSSSAPSEQGEKEMEMEMERKRRKKRSLPEIKLNHILVIKCVPPVWSRDDIIETLSPTEGFLGISLSDVDYEHGDLNRIGWVMYENEENVTKALNSLLERKIKGYELQMIRLDAASAAIAATCAKIAPVISRCESRLKKDYEQLIALVNHLGKEKGIEIDPCTLFSDKMALTEKVDILIEFLRKVHLLCYYCGAVEFNDEAELHRKCGVLHLRGNEVMASHSDNNNNNNTNNTNNNNNPHRLEGIDWTNDLDAKIKARLNKTAGPRSFAGNEEIAKALRKFTEDNCKKVEDGKFQCTLCSKNFMAMEFVSKHHTLRHSGDVEKVKQHTLEEQYQRNFLSNPIHFNQKLAATTATAIIPSQMAYPPLSSSSSFRPRGSGRGGGYHPRGSGYRSSFGGFNSNYSLPQQSFQQAPTSITTNTNNNINTTDNNNNTQPQILVQTGPGTIAPQNQDASTRTLKIYKAADDVSENTDALDFYKSLI